MKTDESAKIDWESWEAESAKVRNVPNPVILLMVAASAPAALVTLWGLLFIVFATKPIRPYASGVWLTADLVMSVLLGVFAGLMSRGLRGFAGIVLGMTGAIALQLFVLTGQASWTPSVATTLSGSSWLPTVATSLGLGLAALVVGYAPIRVALHILAPRPGDQLAPMDRSRRRFAPPLSVATVGILVSALLLADASISAYVHPVALQQITGKNSIVQGAGGLLAVLIAGWAATGTVIEARRPRRSPGRELFAGLATALPLGCLALVAVDLTHNVF